MSKFPPEGSKMKKVYVSLLICISLALIGLCTSCSQSGQGDKAISAQASADISVGDQKIPVWAKGVQEEGELYEGLNLDGEGEADDAVYICPYQFDEYGEKITAIFVHLGTGETVAEAIPTYGRYEFQTGRLLAENKEAIVLEVGIPGSNYGAVNLFIMDILPPRTDEYSVFRDPEITLFLETRNAEILIDNNVPMGFANELIEQGIKNLVEGISVVDIDGRNLQGVSIKVETGGNLQEATICWDHSSYSWKICND